MKHQPNWASEQLACLTSLCRRFRPGQGYEDKIRTFPDHIVPGRSRWRIVAAGALANRPIMHRAQPTVHVAPADDSVLHAG